MKYFYLGMRLNQKLNKIDDIKDYLPDLILWYRNDYHKRDFGHMEMIDRINKTNDLEELELYEKIVDDWL